MGLLEKIFTKPEPKRFVPSCAPYVELSLSVTIQSAGITQLLKSKGGRIVVTDLIVQAQGTNTFQLIAGSQAITPVLAFTVDQPASFGDIILNWPDVLSITCGTNAPMVVSARYRVYR